LIRTLALRTPTLPPATHTNCHVLGRARLTVVDPASPWPEEQQRVFDWLCSMGQVERVVLTHQHADHVGGVEDLRARLGGVPVLAHARTRDALAGTVRVDQLLDEGDLVDTDAGSWEVWHTPGHARGHLCLLQGAEVVCGDMVASEGTIVLEAPEGDLQHYLDSLARLEARGGRLHPAHGAAIEDGPAWLRHYITHRNARTDQIRAALDEGPATVLELVERVYGETIPRGVYPLAARQVRCHLAWLSDRAQTLAEGEHWRRT
jgi:ribonuclease/clavin/mitogillin